MKELLQELESALKVAYEKEELDLEEYCFEPQEHLKYRVFKAEGFTNGLLEAIEIVRLYGRKK